MKLKEIPYLVWFSAKSLVLDLVDLLSALKKAKTWSFILYSTFFLAVYYRQLDLMKIALPLILILYIIRQHKEPNYNKSIRERAFRKNDNEKIEEYYEKYKKHCFYSRKEFKDYDEYKKDEIKKLDEKKYIESGQSDIQS